MQNHRAYSILGTMFTNGKGVAQSYPKAFYWYSKAAHQGYAGAQFVLGGLYLQGQGVTQDYYAAIEWLTKAAKQEYAMAYYILGLMHEAGLGTRQNYKQAKELYGQACDRGVQDGCDSYRQLNEQGF